MGTIYTGNPVTEGMLEALAELLAGAVGTDAKLHLYKAGFTPGPTTTEADFELNECDFNTYAPATITWGTPGLNSLGQPIVYSDGLDWQNVSGANPNMVGGAWLHIDAAGPPAVDVAMNYYPFDVPVPMTSALATLHATLALLTPDLTGFVEIDV